jgi:hypothetical protein
VEAHVILPWYEPLLTLDEVFTAEDRLTQVDFDPHALLTQVSLPEWVDAK